MHVLPQYEKIELMTKKQAGLIFEDERFEIHWLENHVIHPPLTPLTELSRENVRKVSYVPSPSQRDRIEKMYAKDCKLFRLAKGRAAVSEFK